MFKVLDGLERAFWGIFDFLTSVRRAKDLKADPDRAEGSVYFGLHAIACGVSMFVASVFVGLFIMLKIFSIPTLNVVLGIAFGVSGAFLLAHTVKNWVLQHYITTNRMTWISLAAVIACIVGSVAILLIFAFAI